MSVKRRTSGRDVLERSGGRQVERLTQLAHQLPGVDGVQQVDVARLAVQHLEWQRLTRDGQNGRRVLGSKKEKKLWVPSTRKSMQQSVKTEIKPGADCNHTSAGTVRCIREQRCLDRERSWVDTEVYCSCARLAVPVTAVRTQRQLTCACAVSTLTDAIFCHFPAAIFSAFSSSNQEYCAVPAHVEFLF